MIEVKERMTEVMNQAAAIKPCSTEELKKEEQVTLKLQKRIGFQKEKALEIKTMTLGDRLWRESQKLTNILQNDCKWWQSVEWRY